MISIFLLLIPLLLLISIVYWSIYNGISPTPTTRKQAATILRAIPPDTKGTIYEFGSGWGTLAISVAKRFPECRVVGVENSPIPYLISKLAAFFSGIKNIQFLYGDFLNMPVNDASIVICYLYPGGMKELKPKLEQLAQRTLVISNTFSIPGWEPAEIFRAPDLYHSPIYVYRNKKL